MKIKIIFALLIFVLGCTAQTPDNLVEEENQKIWEEPRTITLLTQNSSKTFTFYPNNESDKGIITNEIKDEYRQSNVIVSEHEISQDLILAIERFFLRNDISDFEVKNE